MMLSSEFIKKHRLYLQDFERNFIHWTGLKFTMCATMTERITLLEDLFAQAIQLLPEEEKRIRFRRWQEFEEANKYMSEFEDWVSSRCKVGGVVSDELLKKYISNLRENEPIYGKEEFTDLVPQEMQKRLREARALVKEVLADTWVGNIRSTYILSRQE